MPAFARRTALITGAASGIGLSVAHRLAAEGAARLVLVDANAAALDAVALPCDVVRVAGDVRDEALWEAIDLAGLDHAVINAGVGGGGAIVDLDFAEWRRIVSINLDGAFLALRAAMRAMKRGGSIVLTASVAAFKAAPGISAYGASKAGVAHMARIAALEGAPLGIRVNAIAPGGVDTSIWETLPAFVARSAEIGRPAAIAEMEAAMPSPLGRFAKPEEIAAHVAFLLSDEAAFTTGTILVSDGGVSL